MDSASPDGASPDGAGNAGAVGAPVIRVRGLVTRFGAQLVHDRLDLDVRRGEVLGVVGGSGSGKSVLLRTILGLNRPAAGTVEVLGLPIDGPESVARSGLAARWGVLFQDGALFGGMSVAENVQVPLREQTALAPALVEEVARIKIAMAGLPADAADKLPAQLSGGMRKRAGLARALALDPEILFLDEPTAGLDPIGAEGFDDLIAQMKASLGLTVVMVTHDLDTLVAITDRIAVLVDGKIRVDTLARLRQDPHPWIHDYFHGPRGRAALSAVPT
jgi:phospholipid/cholesterol/gamma-HCH transport system ATP-binding protein